MVDKSTDALIKDLSDGLMPVKPMMHPAVRVLPWLVGAILYTLTVGYFLVPRADLEIKLQEAGFLFETGLTTGIFVTAALAASYLAVPDLREKRWLLAVPVALFAVFILFVGVNAYVEGLNMPAYMGWHHCVLYSFLLGAVPMAALIFLSRMGATTHEKWMAFMNILAVGSLGWTSLRFVCGADTFGHTFLYHFLPFLIVGCLLGMLARKIYRW